MKLNWKFDQETKALRAEAASGQSYSIYNVGETWSVSRSEPPKQEAKGWVSVSCRWANSGIPTLEEAMSLCRRDAEEQEKRRETKFPSTMDAAEWLVGFVDANRKLVVKAGPGDIQPELAKWFRAALCFGYDKGLVDQAKNYANAKAQELGEKTKWSCDSGLVEERLNELEKRLDGIGTTAAKTSSRVGQLWQKHTDELREANKRIGKLEESK